jgi:benzylsuccinate CoA-transferase BbsF subunit
VLDLSWVFVGPSAVRVLADYGATVVKVESRTRGDPLRGMGTFKDEIPGADRSGSYHNANAGKLELSLNLSKPEAREVLKRLVQWADVLVESFTPKAMRNWGLQYESVRALNPRLIFLSTCQGGQTGPYSEFAGYGNHGAALAGFTLLCGWPDRVPAGPWGPYTDFVTPPFITTAILAALEERDRTGCGQHIDVAQMEAPIHFLAPVMLDHEVNGHILKPDGNRDAGMAPHGVFPCQGGGPGGEAPEVGGWGRDNAPNSEERWVAIAVQDDAQWRALCQVIARPELAGDARFATLAARKTHEDQLERIIAAWTRERSAGAAQDQLVLAGVPAHVVARAADLHVDPQLWQRGHYAALAHPELGEIVVEHSRFVLSRTPAVIERPGPSCGQDNDAILTQLLHLSWEEVAALGSAGALE